MERANSTSSNMRASLKRGKSFRKLRWKNYVNHLLNLWLFCGNVSVDGRNDVSTRSSLEILLNKSPFTSISEAAAALSFQPSTQSNFENHQSHKSFNSSTEFSNFHRKASHSMSFDDNVVAFTNSNIYASNKSSLSEKLFHLIKSKPEKKDTFGISINHNISPNCSSVIVAAAHKGPTKVSKAENIVNITRFTNDIDIIPRVKKSEITVRNVTSDGGNKLSINYNQSSSRSSQPPKNHGNQNARKRLKNVKKIPANGKNATSKSVSNRGGAKLSKVSLLGLFEMTTHLGPRWEGKSELAAAELAVKHINERRLLRGYEMELITNDTQVTSMRTIMIACMV